MVAAFEYRYRDAGNFKAYGWVVLDRHLNSSEERLVRSRLESGEFFIAEQIGVPPLYDQLYQWSNGPTQSDHCWHEFVGFRELAALPEQATSKIAARDLVARFSIVQQWDEALSPNFRLAI